MHSNFATCNRHPALPMLLFVQLMNAMATQLISIIYQRHKLAQNKICTTLNILNLQTCSSHQTNQSLHSKNICRLSKKRLAIVSGTDSCPRIAAVPTFTQATPNHQPQLLEHPLPLDQSFADGSDGLGGRCAGTIQFILRHWDWVEDEPTTCMLASPIVVKSLHWISETVVKT